MGKDTVSKLYVGQLPLDMKEDTLRSFLLQGGLTIRNVFSLTIKKGYAFIECGDQATADLVIDRFNGVPFCGKYLVIEPATSHLTGNVRNSRVLISPADGQTAITIEDIDQLLSNWGGNLLSMEKIGPNVFAATVADSSKASQLLEECDGLHVNDIQMRVELSSLDTEGFPCEDREHRSRRSRATTTSAASHDNHMEFPLRMLIPAEFVGALIGRNGQTIRSITHSTGARVDVIRGSSVPDIRGQDPEPEKVVTILGPPDKTSAACKRVLEIIAEEISNKKNRGSCADVCLRLLASNSLIGRVIGKGGTNILQMMQETQTKIHVSNQTELRYPPGQHGDQATDGDRIITIRGSIDGMCMAEDLVSAKLMQAYSHDLQAVRSGHLLPYQGMNYGQGYGHIPNMAPFGRTASTGRQTNYASPMMYSAPAIYNQPSTSSYQPVDYVGYYYNHQGYKSNALCRSMNGYEPETTYIYIPSRAVGAVIGTRGSVIRGFIQECGVSIKIANSDQQGIEERKVTIYGPLEGHWKAQYLLIEKLKEVLQQGQGDMLRVRIELLVPSSIVGRLIGKTGTRIKEIQQQTGAKINFIQRADEPEDITVLQIYGTYHQLYNAQARVRTSRVTIKNQLERDVASGSGDRVPTTGGSGNRPIRHRRVPPRSSTPSPNTSTQD